MALQSNLFLAADKTGDILGENTQDQGREDSIVVIAWNHGIKSPRDAAHGGATGKRMHKPFTITKEVDKASALMYQVLVNNETVTKFKLECWRPERTGAEQKYWVVDLEEATISEVRAEQLNSRYPENMQHREREHICMTYQKIIQTFEDGGITSYDDWNVTGGA